MQFHVGVSRKTKQPKHSGRGFSLGSRQMLPGSFTPPQAPSRNFNNKQPDLKFSLLNNGGRQQPPTVNRLQTGNPSPQFNTRTDLTNRSHQSQRNVAVSVGSPVNRSSKSPSNSIPLNVGPRKQTSDVAPPSVNTQHNNKMDKMMRMQLMQLMMSKAKGESESPEPQSGSRNIPTRNPMADMMMAMNQRNGVDTAPTFDVPRTRQHQGEKNIAAIPRNRESPSSTSPPNNIADMLNAFRTGMGGGLGSSSDLSSSSSQPGNPPTGQSLHDGSNSDLASFMSMMQGSGDRFTPHSRSDMQSLLSMIDRFSAGSTTQNSQSSGAPPGSAMPDLFGMGMGMNMGMGMGGLGGMSAMAEPGEGPDRTMAERMGMGDTGDQMGSAINMQMMQRMGMGNMQGLGGMGGMGNVGNMGGLGRLAAMGLM